MRYIGGKGKIARQIAQVMLDSTANRARYIEPFIGGGSILAQMAPHFSEVLTGDVHPDLVMMWQQGFSGEWTPPSTISRDEWDALRYSDPSPDRALAGFGGSFGGKWFRGYAKGGERADGTPRDHQAESSRAVARIIEAVAGTNITVRESDYKSWEPRAGDVVYCDPPYAPSTEWKAVIDRAYGHSDFDYADFWSRMDKWSGTGATVFVSEYDAPIHWREVWSTEKRVTLKRTTDAGGRQIMTERLFTSGSGDPS